MFKLDLEKAEESEIQLPASTGSLNHAGACERAGEQSPYGEEAELGNALMLAKIEGRRRRGKQRDEIVGWHH